MRKLKETVQSHLAMKCQGWNSQKDLFQSTHKILNYSSLFHVNMCYLIVQTIPFLILLFKRSSRGEVNIVFIHTSPTILAASAELRDLPLKSHFSLLYPNRKLRVETRSPESTSLQRSYKHFPESSSSQLREILSTALLPLYSV